ncbi:hypothetical protein BJ742DRAFT_683894 [Cladochytrium replicatum]|nr:hypothetical protein BJ742DRAFT_683894 [Cladochytrium replicatum]
MPISKSPYHSGAYLSKSVVPTSVPQPQANVRNTKSTATSFPCPFPECNKVFQQKFNLKSHLRSHATERAYQCNMCEAAFRRSHDLKRHHRSLHTQVKPFGCDLCDKRFSRMDALKRHTRRHMDGDVSD